MDPNDPNQPDDPNDDFLYEDGDAAPEHAPPPPYESPLQQSSGAPSYVTVPCTSCGYNLTGVSIGGNCPECGAKVDASLYAAGGGRTNGKAITSMVLGICSIPLCMCYGIFSIIVGILGLIFASIASKEIASGGYTDSSKGIAMAGRICSWVGVALGVTYILFIVVIIIIAESTP